MRASSTEPEDAAVGPSGASRLSTTQLVADEVLAGPAAANSAFAIARDTYTELDAHTPEETDG